MAKVKVYEANGIMKYNHNHDPSTGRFTSGGGSSSSSGGHSSYGNGKGSSSTKTFSEMTRDEKRQWYKECEAEFEEKLKEARNHPYKEDRPQAYTENVQQWERRLSLLRQQMKEFEEGE